MKEIAQIRSLSLWIFLVPFIAVNSCLYISVNFHFLENTFLTVDQIGRSGFTIPYLDGSLSISRASRTFPQFLIFKPSMVITAFLLCVYWYKNNILINYFKNTESTKKNSFMIFGILSAVFLIIHSLLLGIEADIKIFKLLRRVVLVSFIIFEIIAQSMLVINFYKLKLQLSDLSNSMILKCKIILVSILIFVALVSIPLLVKSGNVHFKHGLEWNYFIGVILFYLLTRFFWKKKI
jgi:hypothetical protein